MTDTNHKKTVPLIIVIVILVILGSLFGFVMARFTGKNSIDVRVRKQVRLAEDIYIKHPENHFSGYYDDAAHGEEGTPLLIPAGTEGSVEADFWYYSVYLKDGGYNEFIRKQFDTVTVKFRLDEGMIKVRFTDQPSESYRTMEITQYDFDGGKKKVTFTDITEEFDSGKLESYDTTLAEINQAINEYHSKWISREITGGIIGLVISLIATGIIILIRKNSLEITIDSTLIVIIIVIDVILILANSYFLYAFTRLL